MNNELEIERKLSLYEFTLYTYEEMLLNYLEDMKSKNFELNEDRYGTFILGKVTMCKEMLETLTGNSKYLLSNKDLYDLLVEEEKENINKTS